MNFIKNGTIFGKSGENIDMELEGYDLIERKLIESKIGKIDLKDVLHLFSIHSFDKFF